MSKAEGKIRIEVEGDAGLFAELLKEVARVVDSSVGETNICTNLSKKYSGGCGTTHDNALDSGGVYAYSNVFDNHGDAR